MHLISYRYKQLMFLSVKFSFENKIPIGGMISDRSTVVGMDFILFLKWIRGIHVEQMIIYYMFTTFSLKLLNFFSLYVVLEPCYLCCCYIINIQFKAIYLFIFCFRSSYCDYLTLVRKRYFCLYLYIMNMDFIKLMTYFFLY